MHGTEPRFYKIVVVRNLIQKHNDKIYRYLDIRIKCQHVIKDEHQTGQQG